MEYKLKKAVDEINSKRNRLIIAIEDSRLIEKALSKMGVKCINLNLKLSEKLLDIPVNKRSRMIGIFVNDILKANNDEIISFTGYEILFQPELKQDPMRLFEELSKERIIIIPWRGKYENGILYYAEPWHREYYESSDFDAEII